MHNTQDCLSVSKQSIVDVTDPHAPSRLTRHGLDRGLGRVERAVPYKKIQSFGVVHGTAPSPAEWRCRGGGQAPALALITVTLENSTVSFHVDPRWSANNSTSAVAFEPGEFALSAGPSVSYSAML